MNSKRSGIPSRRRALDSLNQEIVRFLPESRAPFSKLRATSSSKMLSQSSNTNTQLASEYLYRVWNKPIGVALPLTTSARSFLPEILSNKQAFSISCSTPKLLPTPGGPDTIIARMSPEVAALVISVKMSKRSRIRVIASSSDSATRTCFSKCMVLGCVMPLVYSIFEMLSTLIRIVSGQLGKAPPFFTVT